MNSSTEETATTTTTTTTAATTLTPTKRSHMLANGNFNAKITSTTNSGSKKAATIVSTPSLNEINERLISRAQHFMQPKLNLDTGRISDLFNELSPNLGQNYNTSILQSSPPNLPLPPPPPPPPQSGTLRKQQQQQQQQQQQSSLVQQTMADSSNNNSTLGKFPMPFVANNNTLDSNSRQTTRFYNNFYRNHHHATNLVDSADSNGIQQSSQKLHHQLKQSKQHSMNI